MQSINLIRSPKGNTNVKFEHLVEINDPADPLSTTLTRLQLWRGLVLRAEEPTLFVPQMDSCLILERKANSISRSLTFGNLVVSDQVFFTEESRIVFHIPEQGEILASTLEVIIEEPLPERLFVRFIYEDTSSEDGPDAFYNSFRRSAWREADIDTIKIIRKMTDEGRFD